MSSLWSWFGGGSSGYQRVPDADEDEEHGLSAGSGSVLPPASAADPTTLHITNREVLPQQTDNRGVVDKLKGLVGLAPPPVEETSWLGEWDRMMSLSRTQRLWGWGVTFVIGWLLSSLSLIAIPQIARHPEKFALLYTAGNVVSLASTAFLWGPSKQIRDMFKPERAGATIVYLMSMALTLFCAFGLKLVMPTLIALAIQFLAMVWYCASYIPYGHTLIMSMLTSCCGACID